VIAGALVVVVVAVTSDDGERAAPVTTTTVPTTTTTTMPLVGSPGAEGLGDPYFPGLGNGGYDVEHYELDLTWRADEGILDGVATVSALASEDLSRFNLDLSGLEVQSVTVDGEAATFEHADRELQVTPAEVLADGDGFRAVIAYRGRPQPVSDGTDLFEVGWQTDGREAFVASEPIGAMTFFPANDHPTDKATYTLRVTAPEDQTVAANGLLVAENDTGHGTRSWTYEARDPMGQERDPAKSELFLVEGDSAGGSAKQGRNRAFQAILPLRGKILNVERARLDRILGSNEIGTLITALGTGIRDDFDIGKLRYHRIIIMTDADVDGSHIRTLLLTFFYRQMQDIIDGGYLYIAQPPLYRVKRGNMERYLKNEAQMDDYLIASGLENARLVTAGGTVYEGEELAQLVEVARRSAHLIHALERRLPAELVEAAVLAGALTEETLTEQAAGQGYAGRIAERLNAGPGDSWSGARAEDGTLVFVRQRGERRDRFRLDPQIARSPEGRRLNSAVAALRDAFASPATMERRGVETSLTGPLALLEALTSLGRRGLSVQRYKGLGEMNPGQLWETTLDPEVRTLYQVKVEHVDAANEVFATLMGDVVEPRREFIQTNALKVVNLDV
jgi:hypothetical protein